MLDPTTSRIWKACLQSGLLDVERLQACWEAVPLEKRDAPEHIDRRIGRQAVLKGLLTLWQAQQLLAGRVTGFRVDRYILLDLLGQGGMGRVYRARDTRLDREVALKILSPERMNNPRAIERFQREAKVGAQLEHVNLVRLYDFGESQGRHFLVMEFIKGQTLGHWISTQGRVPPAAAARFCHQVAMGLNHAHEKGLIHRDVNPYNIMVTPDGTAKLADMGLAIDLADERKVTRDGATVGTFDYVAPEQARHSHSADIRSDIYSLGCSLYHMLAGQVPFRQPGLAEKLFAHQSQEPPALGDLSPDVPAGLVAVVRRMMRKKPEERFQTPLSVADALRPFIEQASEDSRTNPSMVEETSATSSTPVTESTTQPVASSTVDGSASSMNASEEFSIRVDLGPPSSPLSARRQTSWFGGSGSQASRSASDSAPSRSRVDLNSTIDAIKRYVTRDRLRRLTPALVIGLSVVGILVYSFWNVLGSGGPIDDPSASKPSESLSGRGREATQARIKPIAWGDASFAVLSSDGSAKVSPNLLHAMETALGGKGIVIVRRGTSITLSAAEPLRLSGRGLLEIRGEEGDGDGARLNIELTGKDPFLTFGSSIELLIANLTFDVHRPEPPEGQPASGNLPPPLILTGGKATLQQSAFRTIPTAGYAGSRVIVAKGNLIVEGCWFEGFEAAVEANMLAGSTLSISQSMFVSGGTPADAEREQRPVRSGWAARVLFEGGGRAGASRTVRIDHTTTSGEGLVKLDGFSPSSNLKVEVRSTVVRAERLLDWRPATADVIPSQNVLGWKGVDNQFDVTQDSWISGSTDPEAGREGVTVESVEEWAKLYDEVAPINARVQFSMASTALSDGRLSPDAYSLLNPPSPKPGAEPTRVGPRN